MAEIASGRIERHTEITGTAVTHNIVYEPRKTVYGRGIEPVTVTHGATDKSVVKLEDQRESVYEIYFFHRARLDCGYILRP